MAAKIIICQARDENGNVLVGAKLNVYDAGTTTRRSIFTDSALSVASANPAIADSDGIIVVFIDDTAGDAKFILTNSAESVIYYTQDDFDPTTGPLLIYPLGGNQALETSSTPTFAGLTLNGNLDMSGNSIILDADNDSTITVNGDDSVSVYVGGTEVLKLDGASADKLILDNVSFAPTGAAVGQALGFPNDATTLEPYTPTGGGNMLRNADENISGIFAGGQADTISALQVRSVAGLSDGDVCYVSEAYRWGRFRWTTGDQSANVSADGRGVWLATVSGDVPVDGSQGAWQRVLNGELYVDWFIASTDTDDTDGIQAALDFAINGEGVGSEFQRGATVKFARRNYTISSEIEPDDGGTPYGWLRLIGQGMPDESTEVDASTAPTADQGGTHIVCTHTSGSGFRFKRGPLWIENITVDSDWNRKNNGDQTTDCGIRIEPEDTTSSAARLKDLVLKHTYGINQPGPGVALIGNMTNVYLFATWGQFNKGHGTVIDRGHAVGRQNLLLGGFSTSDGAITASGTTLTSASNGFADASPGDNIVVQGAGTNGYPLETTIASVTSSGEIELSVAASTTVSGAYVQYGASPARPGIINLDTVYGSDNGGHGLAIGHPANGFNIPYRISMRNIELYRNADDASVRYSEHGFWCVAQQYFVHESASDGNLGTQEAYLFGGDNFRLQNLRVINSTNDGILIADRDEWNQVGSTDTGSGGRETDNFSIENVFGVGGSLVNPVRLSANVGTNKAITGIYDANYTGDPYVGTGRNGLWVRLGEQTDYLNGNLSLGYGTEALPALALAQPANYSSLVRDTGLYRRNGNEINVSVSGDEKLRIDTNGVVNWTSRGSAGAPVIAHVSDTTTGFYFEFNGAQERISFSAEGSKVLHLDPDGIELESGKVVKVGGTQVVGAQVVDANLAGTAALTAQTLTDNSGGTASDTIAAIGASYSQSEVANAVASLADEVNKLRADTAAQKAALDAALTLIRTHGLGATS